MAESNARLVEIADKRISLALHDLSGFEGRCDDIEQIRDHAFRVTYGNWAFLKNESRQAAEIANRKLAWIAYIGGKRESPRLLGDVILKQQDLEDRTEFPDASVTTTWSIDLQETPYQPARRFKNHLDGSR